MAKKSRKKNPDSKSESKVAKKKSVTSASTFIGAETVQLKRFSIVIERLDASYLVPLKNKQGTDQDTDKSKLQPKSPISTSTRVLRSRRILSTLGEVVDKRPAKVSRKLQSSTEKHAKPQDIGKKVGEVKEIVGKKVPKPKADAEQSKPDVIKRTTRGRKAEEAAKVEEQINSSSTQMDKTKRKRQMSSASEPTEKKNRKINQAVQEEVKEDIFPVLKSFTIRIPRCEVEPTILPTATAKFTAEKKATRVKRPTKMAQRVNAEVIKRTTRKNTRKDEAIEVSAEAEENAAPLPTRTVRNRGKGKKNFQNDETSSKQVETIESPEASPKPANLKENTPAESVSPRHLKLSTPTKFLKKISMHDVDDDPYIFKMSQSDVVSKKVVKKTKKPRAKQKPGGKMDLLMKQQELDAVEYSCNVQNNPVQFKDQRVNLEKQLEQLTSTAKVCVNLEPSEPTRKPAEKEVFSKVWHSVQEPAVAQHTVEPATNVTFSNDSLKTIQAITRNNPSFNTSTPLRVPGNLPTAFYMELSKKDGTPTFSSDVIVPQRERRSSNDESNRTEATAEQIQNVSSESSSFLSLPEDSNAENIQPVGYKSPLKQVTSKPRRSPFKPLPTTSLAVDNTFQRTDVDAFWGESNDSAELLDACEQAENELSKIKQSPYVSVKTLYYDSFGFDDLLDDNQPIVDNSQKLRSPTRKENIHEKLQNMKRYLPSNRNRGGNVVQSSPVKKMRILNSPSQVSKTSVREYFIASTPVSRPLEATNKQNFATTQEMSSVEESVSKIDESDIKLFEESVEPQNTQRTYKRKRVRVNEICDYRSDSEVELGARPEPVKPPRKKPNIEETREFKKFVREKSSEFAEVGEYEMVIE